MFPNSLGPVLMVIGAVWLVQGLGLADTGSFMDGQRLWAVIGAAFFVAGVLVSLSRRRSRRPPDPPDSG